MRTFIAALGMVIVMGVSLFYRDAIMDFVKNEEVAEVTNEKEALEEVNVEPAIPDEWQKEAEKAYQDVLRRKSLEAEKALLEAQIASTTRRIDDIDKELGLY